MEPRSGETLQPTTQAVLKSGKKAKLQGCERRVLTDKLQRWKIAEDQVERRPVTNPSHRGLIGFEPVTQIK
jgi:hypothetical protein